MSWSKITGPSSSGRAVLTQALQDKGFSKDVAQRAIKAIISAWKQTLARHLPVEVPGGWLGVKEVRQRRCIRFGHLVDVPQYKFRVFFRGNKS